MVKTEPQPRRSRRNSSAGSSKDLLATKKESKSDNSGNGSSAAAATSSANSTIATITKGTKRTRSDSSASNKSNRSNNNATKRSSNGTSNGVKKERKDSSCENDGDASNGDWGREQQQSGSSGSEAINEKPDEVMKEMEVDSKAGIGNAQGENFMTEHILLRPNPNLNLQHHHLLLLLHFPTPTPPSTSTTSTTAKTHTTSPLSSHLHSSHLTLSSTLILDHFGPTVQTVFDCLALKGDLGFEDLRAVLRKVCGKVENGDRRRVVEEVMRKMPEFFLQSQAAADSEIHGYVVSKTSIKAALLVLINHGIVETTQLTPPTPNCPTACFTYGISLTRASRLSRYDRYVTHVRNSIGNTESLVLRQVLCRGMMRTEDCVSEVAEVLLEEKEKEEKESLGGEERRKEVKKFRKEVVRVIVELRGMHLLKEAPTTGERSGGGGSDMACVEKDEKEVVEIVGRGEVEEGSVWMVDVELVDDRLKGEKVRTSVARMCSHA
ncbi:hypothetical protein TL16_g11981 [Triparma laevis f. inornata]|uniref:DNA-directed RNA polymerase III subunit RPC3 n=1 Tax=Triparma laevis f. inornata TaxID=1714386 RepID=A0A9W7BRS8_9STRA|nr:hypothetical protein TL16_g11981 [Triparma laevis f. inornata]